MIVLLTDRQNESGPVTRQLGLIGPCRVVPLHTALKMSRAVSLLVSNVSMERAVSVQMLRAGLAQHRDPDVPLLCLLDDMSHRAQLQAYAIGATAVLDAQAGQEALVSTALDLLGASGAEAGMRQAVRGMATRAGAAMAQMLDDAAAGRPVGQESLAHGAELVLQAVQEGSIHGWLDVVWNYDDATYRHSLLVAGLAGAFALKLRFRIGDRRRVTRAALLHDIGKARVPLSILNKTTDLSAEEDALLRRHPLLGHEILSRQGDFTAEQLDVVRHHHEYLDGSGYPDGLSGAQVADVVRLLTICDSYAGLLGRGATPAGALVAMAEMEGQLDMAMLEAFRATVATAPARPAEPPPIPTMKKAMAPRYY